MKLFTRLTAALSLAALFAVSAFAQTPMTPHARRTRQRLHQNTEKR